MNIEHERALRTVRVMLDLGHPLDVALEQPVIPEELREVLREEIERDRNFTLVPARTITNDVAKPDWVAGLDRSLWYFWPTLRQFLLAKKGWSVAGVRSLDDSSDRILRQLSMPSDARFDVRGLVLGFVQSGKTANFTALIAKAVDAGYRLVIVLSGVDNGLRRQTNARLKKELVGFDIPRPDTVALPPLGQRWHEFTREEFDGDFQPGFANHAALQGSQPVLLVVKKNGAVLRRLIRWLEQAPGSTRRELPVLVIDDEADQASIDTRGVPAGLGAQGEDSYEPPSVINGLIRSVLQLFDRRAYVAYTATPFANILIPHDVDDPRVGNDLYPKDFIVDLPKQPGYFGAEEFFGRVDDEGGGPIGGLDVIRLVADEDIAAVEDGDLPESAVEAMIDFVLAGAARADRGDGDKPAAMLVHTSSSISEHNRFKVQIELRFGELRDEWRYQRSGGIRARFMTRWKNDQALTTRRIDFARERAFEAIEPHIGPFLEAVEVREINSDTREVLDYEREPGLKAIAVGGNRLSRGLTIEGLLVSYFVRRSPTYDTLMQMGRWFGYRAGYEDLTRIYTTAELAQWFSDLAMVEYRLRQDIEIYEDLGLTPVQVGLRIWRHPSMQVTSVLKQRFASTTMIRQSFDLSLEQTFKFPFRRPEVLAQHADANKVAVMKLIGSLGDSDEDDGGRIWNGVSPRHVMEFLRDYEQDEGVRSISMPLVLRYIEECVADDELTEWTVAIRGRKSLEPSLGIADWGSSAGTVRNISRTRLKGTDSLGVITGQGDEAVGLAPALYEEARAVVDTALQQGRKKALNTAAREVRPAKHGVLLLYPISRYSGQGEDSKSREAVFADPEDRNARDLVGIAISFPHSEKERQIDAFVTGTVGWRPTAE
jgi:hypothetical protein